MSAPDELRREGVSRPHQLAQTLQNIGMRSAMPMYAHPDAEAFAFMLRFCWSRGFLETVRTLCRETMSATADPQGHLMFICQLLTDEERKYVTSLVRTSPWGEPASARTPVDDEARPEVAGGFSTESPTPRCNNASTGRVSDPLFDVGSARNESGRHATDGTPSSSGTTPSEPSFEVIQGADKRTRFRCLFPGCGKSFTLKANLKRHWKGHLGLRPFVCTTCRALLPRDGAIPSC